ncbi:aldehyde dehydrogenase family protein [Alicyclobacillus mali (ex Roth et al. 2021)]|uniref:aldehyde dehydrogenase family protein n=1 Tax=Alicyclobacillus mali (ex Roth et al. 2021) TaxID=1123961 RepID=UPI0008352FC6|nr:aldehyde dehydrogenase family protein [Alicyclobacillus mali (ex Roth et al. 2021)]
MHRFDPCLNFIGGRWCEPKTGQYGDNVNPANGEVLGVWARSGADDLDDAVRAAREAQAAWRLVPAPERAKVLRRVADLLRERKDEIAQTLTMEMGKVIEEARGEVQEAIDMADYMAGEGRRLFGQTTPSELPDKFAMSVRAPVGVVGIITPWNFPIAIASWKSLPAIVAGNAVVLKPAEETPLTARAFAEVYQEAGLPAGVLNVVFGDGPVVGEAMLSHPGIDVISFTGSTETGRHIASRAGANLKRVSLEMGGKNAITVLADADLDLAVDAIVWSAYGTSGQRCTAASRVIVEREVEEALLARLLPRVQALRVGDGLDPAVHVGPVIHEEALAKIDRYVRLGVDEGARLMTGGRRLTEGTLAQGYYYAPTVFAGVRADMRIAQEEIFGPVLCVMAVDSFEDAIRVNNGVKYGLSASIFTRDVNRVFRAMRDLDTGIVYVNAGTTGAEIHLPFGGTKATGNGHRDSGQAALDVFTEWKTVYVDYSGRLQRAQIDNN